MESLAGVAHFHPHYFLRYFRRLTGRSPGDYIADTRIARARRLLQEDDSIRLGGETLTVLHTPGHSPGHLCFWEEERGYLFTGDLAYKGMLTAYFPSTDPQAYLQSLE